MKNFILVLMLAFSMPALAETVKTAGESEVGPEATLNAIQKYFKEIMPTVQGDDFVDGSMNFSPSSKKYNNYWMTRFVDDIDQPEEYSKAMEAGQKLWSTPFANGKSFSSCFPNGEKVQPQIILKWMRLPARC